MTTVLFIGERRSKRAKLIGARWESKQLASRSLHDALAAVGFAKAAAFINIATPGAWRVIISHEGPRIAMGRKVQEWCERKGIGCDGYGVYSMTHPAARGKIRRKDRYAAHVRDVLTRAGVLP